MSELVFLKCVACRGGEPVLSGEEIETLKPEVSEWQIIEEEGVKKLWRSFKLKNFEQALNFTNQVGEIAEAEDHHPLIQTEWGGVKVVWWTHKIRGLHKNDFIMAAKTDAVYRREWEQ